jgi:hypothetical protein
MSTAEENADTQLEFIQRWFQSVISHPEGVVAGAGGVEELEARLTSSNSLDAAGRLSVYADAYFARLIECMGEVFPMIKKFLGEETFDSFAFEYLQAIPSKSYTLHHLGRQFPGWLEKSRPEAGEESGLDPASAGPEWPELMVDLARMEWAVYETFDGPGSEGQPSLKIADIQALMSEDVDRVHLIPAPCLNLLTARFPVNEFYTALRRAEAGEDVTPPAARPAWTALHRRQFVVQRYDLNAPAHAMLEALIQGLALGEALDAAAALWPDSDESLGEALQSWFRQWAEEGFFLGVRTASGSEVGLP